ncbi:30S ribosomal protein S6 [Mesomycoplasma bovoculi]|uniref:Small ribosomal subunit protein bS6 n=1 Tax=Mesomycoplasma bovoculi M165/69 TaxID=743966 RepID=W5UUJ2_9BACT|nr:30S ribosomal protein S6 [Mesomycoplasma bovoculi]AHH45455.1 30S ribosomal protein S6 [Mesomycoplasma bovoculi M165/69]
MSKYEVMFVLDPKADISVAEKISTAVFTKAKIEKFEKLERTNLAYEINKSKTANFVLMLVNSEPNLISEFSRRLNIEKSVWRYLIINLDSEKGLNKISKARTPRSDKFKSYPKTDKNEQGEKRTYRRFVVKADGKTSEAKSSTSSKITRTTKEKQESKSVDAE